MSIDLQSTLGVHEAALALRAERTRVLAANIANESTPGFQARDLDFNALMSRSLAGDTGPEISGHGDAALFRVPYHASADGNTVELGIEQAAFSQNASDFQTSLTFLGMKLRGLAKAIAGQ